MVTRTVLNKLHWLDNSTRSADWPDTGIELPEGLRNQRTMRPARIGNSRIVRVVLYTVPLIVVVGLLVVSFAWYIGFSIYVVPPPAPASQQFSMAADTNTLAMVADIATRQAEDRSQPQMVIIINTPTPTPSPTPTLAPIEVTATASAVAAEPTPLWTCSLLSAKQQQQHTPCEMDEQTPTPEPTSTPMFYCLSIQGLPDWDEENCLSGSESDFSQAELAAVQATRQSLVGEATPTATSAATDPHHRFPGQ